MSESIKITFVIEGENKNLKEVNAAHDTSMTVMSTLLKEGLISETFCGGKGICKKCRIRFLTSMPLPCAVERSFYGPDELRDGYRLACMAKPRNDCVIRLDFVKSSETDIVTDYVRSMPEMENVAEEVQNDKQTVMTAGDVSVSLDVDSDGQYNCIIAVDLGTTTIAMQLMDMETGVIIDTYCTMNPQRKYGADVLSRIQAAADGNAGLMRESVLQVICDGIDRFSGGRVNGRALTICCMCIAGNTTMEHLLMGLSTQGLGKSPFVPVELGLQKFILDKYGLPVYVTPGISVFVGGDISAGLYHCNLLGLPDTRKYGAVLFIDLGTNGEMAITDGNRTIVTATAAGPAFEGGAGAAVTGSDMIKITAMLLEKGIVDETGLLAEPYFEKGIDVTQIAVHLTQSDIRALQMAKAAIRAGIDILCKKMGHPEISRVYLAGGFGYFLDVDSAVRIGLLPEKMRACTQAAGNTSLAGAYEMGRDLWKGNLEEDTLNAAVAGIESINLAQEEEFESLYLGYLNF